MNETKKLYDLNAYTTEFDAKVLSCEAVANKEGSGYEVILNQTLFFPEEGGQSCDCGTLGNTEVLDVQIKKNIIFHIVKQPLLVGETVHGMIDWNHRYNNMQQHSGEHIFSGLVHKRFGYDNVGFHLSNQIVTMDFNGALTQEDVDQLEYAANEVIDKNVPILVSLPSKEELSGMEYRSKKEIEGQVRIVTIPDTDVCACCAPHVRNTGEIGLLKVLSVQNYKQGMRISILCGFRALMDYRTKSAIIAEISSLLSTNQENMTSTVKKLKENNQTLKFELTASKQQYLQEKINSIPKEQDNVFLFETGLDALVIRTAVNQLMESHVGICGVFSGNVETGYQFILGSSVKDVRITMNQLKESLNARGGGSASMVQGSVAASKDQIVKVLT